MLYGKLNIKKCIVKTQYSVFYKKLEEDKMKEYVVISRRSTSLNIL